MTRIETWLRIAAAVCALATGCGEGSDTRASVFSLLAVGDAGAPPSDDVDYPRMLAVTQAMADEDEEHPATALLLLGDNFYPAGLKSSELATRVRANLVRPLCRFVATDGTRYGEVALSCSRDKRPLPLFAVLGNHDYQTPESPRLQRSVVAEFVSNWQMPAGLATSHELPGGVSLILFDSEAVVAGADLAPLVTALRDSAGPWRILAGHRPMATAGSPSPSAEFTAYRRSVRRAIAEAAVPVQLFISGHEHRLSILEMSAPDPGLHLISGTGSNRRKNRVANPRVREDFEALGFARIDLVGTGTAARLSVSLYRVHRYWWIRLIVDRWLAARWSVDVSGRVSEDSD
ncbi:MAG: metallophosphoesterase [Myxococcota bacterium]